MFADAHVTCGTNTEVNTPDATSEYTMLVTWLAVPREFAITPVEPIAVTSTMLLAAPNSLEAEVPNAMRMPGGKALTVGKKFAFHSAELGVSRALIGLLHAREARLLDFATECIQSLPFADFQHHDHPVAY